jgi:hypothetical protein
MADESPQPATPASKGKAAKEMVLLRLMSAGANDTFVVGAPDNPEFVVTPRGVEVPAAVADDLLEFGVLHGVTMAYGPVEDKE